MFWRKAWFAQQAGAVGIIIGNHERTNPQIFQMAWDVDAEEDPSIISIPSVMVSKVHYLALYRDVSSPKIWVNVTLEPDEAYDQPFLNIDESDLVNFESDLVEQMYASVQRETYFVPNETASFLGHGT